MADIDLAVSGKDTQLTITLNGALIKVSDQMTNFSSKPMYDEIVVKPLGRSGSFIDKDLTGWEGSVELAASSSDVDALIDLVNASIAGRIPYVINLVDTTNYRDLTSKTYTYPDCKCEFDKRVKRGDATTVTINFKTGSDRIAG